MGKRAVADDAGWRGLIDEAGRPLRAERDIAPRNVLAGYDVLINRNKDDHWRYATQLAQYALDTPDKMQTMRNFARYEFRNNNYARGLVLKTVQEVIGTGPSLQIEPLVDNPASRRASKLFERNWSEYADESRFVAKLVMSLTEYFVGGESFNVFRPNEGLKTVPVDFEVYEADQFTTPWLTSWSYGKGEYPPVDGIVFDAWGNPSTYHRLRYHPGGNYIGPLGNYSVDYVEASVCAHLFRRERPTQFRGISHLVPSLPLFALLRRYLEATTRTAEAQARIAGSMRTAMDIESCDDVGDEPIEIRIGDAIFTNLPRGWQLDPFKANQPAQGIMEFVSVIKHEINSNWMIPWNVATSDSSDYNFASGRLDHITFYHMVQTIRAWLSRDLLNRFFSFWFDFAVMANFVPSRLGKFVHRWYWDKREPIDEMKQAQSILKLQEAGVFDEERYFREMCGVDAYEVAERNARLSRYKASLQDNRETDDNGEGAENRSEEAA